MTDLWTVVLISTVLSVSIGQVLNAIRRRLRR